MIEAQRTSIRVLVIEDRASDAELMIAELRRAGFDPAWIRVQTEHDFLSRLADGPDLILADYTLPGFSAPRALRLLQEKRVEIPCIIVSGSIGEDMAVDAMRAGAADYLLKDRLTRLGPAVGRALEARRLRETRRRTEEALRESEERFRRLAENAPDIIFRYRLLPAVGFEYVSPAMTTITGYAPEEFYADPALWQTIVHPEDLRLLTIPVRREDFSKPLVLRLRRKDGTMIWTEQRRVPIFDPAGRLSLIEGISRDITQQKQAEDQARRQFETLAILYASAQKLSQRLDLQQLADYVAESGVRTLGASYAMVARADAEGEIRDLSHYPAEAHNGRAPLHWDDPEDGPTPIGRSLRAGRPVVVNDVTADHAGITPENRALVLETGLRSVGVFPLITRDTPFGVLGLGSTEAGFFTPERTEFFQAFAHLAAAALEDARLYEEAERRLEHLQALRDVDSAITSSLDVSVVLNVLLDKVTAHLRVDAADILVLNPHTQVLECAAARGFRGAVIRETRLRLGEGPAGQAAVERRTVHIPDLSKTYSEFTRGARFRDEGFVSFYATPLLAKGQVKGVLEAFHRGPLAPDQEWLDFLETLAGQAAVAVDSISLFENLQRANAELVLAYDTTLEGWVRALDLRDKETEGHTQRVTELTLRLARHMGVRDDDLVHVRRGSLLHDIGKMGIPDSILLKPGALTPEEWKVMKMHPVYALQLLAPVAYLKPALTIPYAHHEKWDGTGYPRGLKALEIPLEARVFAVSDVYDALTSDRPYRAAWPRDRVMAHIREQAATHFDPAVVDAFLSLDPHA